LRRRANERRVVALVASPAAARLFGERKRAAFEARRTEGEVS